MKRARACTHAESTLQVALPCFTHSCVHMRRALTMSAIGRSCMDEHTTQLVLIVPIGMFLVHHTTRTQACRSERAPSTQHPHHITERRYLTSASSRVSGSSDLPSFPSDCDGAVTADADAASPSLVYGRRSSNRGNSKRVLSLAFWRRAGWRSQSQPRSHTNARCATLVCRVHAVYCVPSLHQVAGACCCDLHRIIIEFESLEMERHRGWQLLETHSFQRIDLLVALATEVRVVSFHHLTTHERVQ